MDQLSKKERLTIIEFIFYRRSIYSKLGWVFGLSLLSGLIFISLPPELSINYKRMIQKIGILPTYLVAYFVGKYFDTFSVISVVTKFLVLWLCFYYELQLKRAGKTKVFIINKIFGWGNNVSNNINYTEKDEH